jgi:hypothetical protein
LKSKRIVDIFISDALKSCVNMSLFVHYRSIQGKPRKNSITNKHTRRGENEVNEGIAEVRGSTGIVFTVMTYFPPNISLLKSIFSGCLMPLMTLNGMLDEETVIHINEMNQWVSRTRRKQSEVEGNSLLEDYFVI